MSVQFGRFWLHEKIGHGGMAEIFLASVGPDPRSYNVEVALKRLHEELVGDRVQVDMFLTEADITKFLDHENLLHVYEAGFVGERPYIVMDYVWGIDLGRLMDLLRARSSRFPPALAVFVTLQVLRGLDYIHRAKAPGGEPMDMVHRDVTPPNLFITFDGRVKIGDFGVAHVRFIEPREEARFVKGKWTHIPPEVLAGTPVSAGDDLWGLSCCLYEMLTGRPMEQFVDAVDEDDIRHGLATISVPPIRRINPEIDEALAKLVDVALSPKPKKRPTDAESYYRLLKGYLARHDPQVGREALGRFVRSATGTKDLAAPRIGPMDGWFETSPYHAPTGPSMTQRILVVERRRRRWVWPVLAAVAAGVVALGVTLAVVWM